MSFRKPSIFKGLAGNNYNEIYSSCMDYCDAPAKHCVDHCRQYHPNNKECEKLCHISHDTCKTMCNEIWPYKQADNPYLKCTKRCWSNGYDRACVTRETNNIINCCERECETSQRHPHLDCKKMCRQYRLNYWN